MVWCLYNYLVHEVDAALPSPCPSHLRPVSIIVLVSPGLACVVDFVSKIKIHDLHQRLFNPWITSSAFLSNQYVLQALCRNLKTFWLPDLNLQMTSMNTKLEPP
jgi:hypothetical protein